MVKGAILNSLCCRLFQLGTSTEKLRECLFSLDVGDGLLIKIISGVPLLSLSTLTTLVRANLTQFPPSTVKTLRTFKFTIYNDPALLKTLIVPQNLYFHTCKLQSLCINSVWKAKKLHQ